MEKEEEIRAMLKRFRESMPRTVMMKVEKTNIGIGMVLRYLAEAGRPASAGEISRFTNVSTARMAVLLRTMEEKGLIERSEDPSDARKILIGLSEKGQESNRRMADELVGFMAEIVDEVGMERMELFVEVSGEINAAVERIAKARTARCSCQ